MNAALGDRVTKGTVLATATSADATLALQQAQSDPGQGPGDPRRRPGEADRR